MKLEVCDVAPTNWPVRTLESVCHRVTSGGTPSRRNPAFFENGAWPWVKTQELRDTWIDTTEEHITNEAVAKSSAKVLPANTVLLAMYGATVGQLGILRRPMTCNQACCALIVDPKQANYRYIFYQLLNARAQLKSLATGAAQQNLSGTLIKSIRLPVPSIKEQDAIVQLLGALDDKIELNRRMSETLHQIAESTFKDMFLPSAIGASEISEVAESTIGDEIDVTMGQSPPGSTYNTEGQGLPFYQGRTDFGMLFPTRRVYCTAPTRLAREGDTLLSVRAPVGDVNVAVEDCAIGRGVAALRHRSGSRVFTYFLARSLHATFDQFNGEGTVFGSISKKALLGLACPKPSDSQLHAFEKIGGPILLRLRSAMQESDTLISIRDALLPKLISGELRVPQAEQLVSEVV